MKVIQYVDATGNTMVFKPSSYTSLSALELAKIIDSAGAPPGAVNIVTGPGDIIGKALCEHDHVSKISFTGSTDVGRPARNHDRRAGPVLGIRKV